jgi:hypothetical protein
LGTGSWKLKVLVGSDNSGIRQVDLGENSPTGHGRQLVFEKAQSGKFQMSKGRQLTAS